jgi:hypothetical protein
MADRDIKLGTAADQLAVDPKTDTNRYYYRPGTTEPELRPEIVEAEAKAKAKEAEAATGKDKSERPVERP